SPGAGDGLASFFDPVPPGRLVDEREGGAGPLAFEFGGAEGVGADNADGGRAQRAGGGAVGPVGDRQVWQCRAGVARQFDWFVEKGEAPDGAAAVQDACSFPFDVGLSEDRFDDLAHLTVVDDGVGVLVDGQDGLGVGAYDALPAVDRLVVQGAVRVDAVEGVNPGGDRVPVEPGELAGLVPVAGIVSEQGSFAVPGHL